MFDVSGERGWLPAPIPVLRFLLRPPDVDLVASWFSGFSCISASFHGKIPGLSRDVVVAQMVRMAFENHKVTDLNPAA